MCYKNVHFIWRTAIVSSSNLCIATPSWCRKCLAHPAPWCVRKGQRLRFIGRTWKEALLLRAIFNGRTVGFNGSIWWFDGIQLDWMAFKWDLRGFNGSLWWLNHEELWFHGFFMVFNGIQWWLEQSYLGFYWIWYIKHGDCVEIPQNLMEALMIHFFWVLSSSILGRSCARIHLDEVAGRF